MQKKNNIRARNKLKSDFIFQSLFENFAIFLIFKCRTQSTEIDFLHYQNVYDRNFYKSFALWTIFSPWDSDKMGRYKF